MRRAAKRDTNEPEIVEALRGIGASVTIVNVEALPDLDVGFRRVNYKLEVKSEKGKLTEPQQDYFETWQGQCAIVRSVDEALRVIGAID